MKVTSINSNQTATFKAQSISKNSVKSIKNSEFKEFMTELDKWTNDYLDKIDKNYTSGTLEKEYAIEDFFSIRDAKIENKKAELFPKNPRPLWRRILIALGILSY